MPFYIQPEIPGWPCSPVADCINIGYFIQWIRDNQWLSFIRVLYIWPQVLYLEQLLTTGGGWQDQVGGLMGGVRMGVSPATLPLKVTVDDLHLGPDVIQPFNDRLVLIYTGKTRLARNLLQVGLSLLTLANVSLVNA